jgi:sec-independent protein translocase protein TatC
MPTAGHLREARRRATRAAVSLLVGVVIGFLLTDQILDILRAPVQQLAQFRQASLKTTTQSPVRSTSNCESPCSQR